MSRFVIAIILLFVANSLEASDNTLPPDYWTGPSSSYTGVTDTYTFNNGNVYMGITFYVTKGSVVSQSQSGTTYTVLIQWHTSGTGTIEIDYDTDIFLGTKNVSIQGVSAPATTFTQTFPSCGNTIVTRNSGPGGGLTWYWQTFSTGMDMSNSGSSVTVTSTSPMFLRARMNTSPFAWSVATSTNNITIYSIPPAPATATNGNLISNTGGSVSLSVSTVSGATAYKWYMSETGGSPISGSPTTNSYSPVTTLNRTYYVEAVSGMCTSSTRKAVTAYLHPEPVISTEDGTVNMGAQAVLKVLNHTYDSYQWINAGTGIPVSGATTSTFTTTTAANYSVRVTKGNSPTYTPAAFAVTSGLDALNMNYVISNAVLVPGITDGTQVAGLTADGKSQTVQYFDGLGAPMQTIVTQGSPLKKDIVQQSVYDGFGREHRKYLPVVVNKVSGWYKPGLLNARGAYSSIAESFYQNNPTAKIAQDTMPYTQTVFEASPAGRPLEDFGAGSQWTVSNKRIRYKYRVNTHATSANDTAEKVIAWKIVSNLPVRQSALTGYVAANGYYATSQLSIKVVIDEEGNSVREYTNKRGQVILKKVQATPAGINNLNDLTGSTPGWALTYYVYDHLGNLRFVLPPELSKIIHQNDTYNPTTTDLNNWAFQYTYDLRKRMTTKQVPGAGAVYMVYDKRDRLVMTQDANQRAGATKYWSFTKYDQLNRPILTGIKDTTATQAQMQLAVDTWYDPTKPWRKLGEKFVGNITGNVHGYTNTSYPKTTSPAALGANRYLSVSYYDSYGFKALMGDSSAYSFQAAHLTGQKTIIHKRITGQVAGTKIKVVDGGVAGGYTWLSTVNYYDDDYRVTQTVSDNYKSGTDRITNTYDFSGKVLKTKSTHAESDVTWKDLVSVQLKGNTLIGTTTAAGAASVQQLAAGQNGSLEVIYTEGNTTRFIGLNDANPDVSSANINYAFRFTATNTANVYENNTVKATISNVNPGDLFKIVRTGTAVTYYRNGTLITLSPASTASTTLLMADASYTTANGTLTTVRTSFSTTSHSVIRRFEYDHAGRLINTWHQLDSNPEILVAKNEYNELGQLVDKKLHSTVATGANAKQSIDYRYNIRGWLTKLNESDLSITQSGEARDLFGMQLLYNESDGITNTPLHNGNISGIKWSNNLSLGTVKENAYVYTYDPMNRISTSAFKDKAASWTAATNNGNAETGFSYDLNGNIKTLQRNDKRVSGWMDNLTYTYTHATEGTSNKLRKVADIGDDYMGFVDGSDVTDEYTYDANGNMITDLNKGLSTAITYNFMNLPELVTKGANTINYIYDASGRKLAQVTSFGGIVKQTDYAGEYQYENDQLQHVAHEEGRIVIAKTETVYTNSAEVSTGITASNATLAAVTANGTEKYVRATANGTIARTGIFPVKSLTVVPGETYRIRVKGYRTGANTVHLLIKAGGADQDWPGATLANGATAEAWTEQTVTIPASMTTLEAGVVWNTVTSGQQFFLNEFEIIKVSTNATPEYQYNLKDHLGNVRLTFTAKSQTDSYTATYETSTAAAEDANFSPSYDNVTFISTSIYNHTPGGTRSQRLSAANANEIVGLAKSLSVMPGDTVSMQVFAKYFTPTTTNSNVTAGVLATAIASGFGLTPTSTGEALKAYTSITQMFTAGGMMIGPGEWEDDNAPKAYLNYILFDKDYFPYDMGWDQIDYGPNAAHDELTLIAPIRQPGYIYVYLSNESNKIIDVYFDDLTITHKLGPVVQRNDYYAFGMEFNSYQRENSTKNNYMYNGKERQDELDLGWLDYGARMYMSDIGRWGVIDPLAEKYDLLSPYNYTVNNPIKYVDPDGRDGMVTGKGTKDDPYIITANYYHVKGRLSGDEVGALKNAVTDYKNLGTVEVENADKSKSYVKFDLSVSEVESDDAAVESAFGDKFTDINGEERRYGNIVGLTSGGHALGESDDLRADFNRQDLLKGVANGHDKGKLFKGVAIHEIAHNLGGEEGDESSTMEQVGIDVTEPQVTSSSGGSGVSKSRRYPTATKSIAGVLINKKDKRNKSGDSDVVAALYSAKE